MANRPRIENAKFLMAKQEFLKRFEKLLTDLQNFSINGYFKQTVQRFRSCIQPNEALGESRLPFLSYTAISRKPDKDNCVLCVLSFVIQEYWKFYSDNLILETIIDVHLTTLEGYAKNGRKACKIVGKFPTFHLEKV